MTADTIQHVRRFNRTVAESIGAVGDRFLGRSRALGESRVLWEIGPEGLELRALRARLNLDSGYASRVLQSLQRQRLVRIRTSSADRRVRRVCLSKAGMAERARLDQESDVLAAKILEPLNERQRAALIEAMTHVEQLLRASMVRVDMEDPSTPDAVWCFQQYFAELDTRFDAGFDPAFSISADADELRAPKGLLLLARLRERPIGCGALKFHPGAPAELKRMWVAASARGLGVGRRLLQALERHASESGVLVLRLETNRALTEAISLYRRSGYVEVEAFNDEPYAHHWFEKRIE